MSEFLIKSSVAMGVLLGLYYLLFEREKMHRFNRFYLLSALVFSLALPFITIITYIKEVKVSTEPVIITSQPVISNVITEQPIDYLFYAGWGLYALITFTLIIRFMWNVVPLVKKATANPSVKIATARLVLLEEKVLPHTFLNYIFLNREEHEARTIEEELYTHELTHVKQKHTLDILFIEVLKTIFWFNPLLYFYKKAIQLNHEFLADEKVIDTTANTVYYQNLLLEKASVGTTFSMASNLNFSLTKKRLLMMTKTTSTIKAGYLKIAIAPVVVALMMLLCTKTIAQQTDLKPLELSPEAEAKLERFKMSPEAEAELRKTNPDMFSDDPAVYNKNTVFKFIDKEGKETIRNGYKELTEAEKKKVALSPDLRGPGYLEIREDTETTDPQEIPKTTPSKQNKTQNTKAVKSKSVPSQKPKEIKSDYKKNNVHKPITKPTTTTGKEENKGYPPLAQPNSDGSYTLNLSGAVKTDPDKIKAIEVIALKQDEIEALKKYDPVKYNDETLKGYEVMQIKITQVNDEGQLETISTYEKRPNK